MVNFNKCIVAGEVVSDYEEKKTKGGMSVVNLKISVTNSYTDKATDTVKERVNVIPVAAFGNVVKSIENIKRGSVVFVEGSLNSRSWEKKDGTTSVSLDVVASKIFIMENPASVKAQGGETFDF